MKSFGHTIVNEANVATNNAAFLTAPPTAAQLVGVDLILYSRSNTSTDFIDGAGEVVAWNSLAKPILAMSNPIIRGGPVGTANGNNRFGWVNSSTTVGEQPTPTDLEAFPNPSHPFVNGQTTSCFRRVRRSTTLTSPRPNCPTGAMAPSRR